MRYQILFGLTALHLLCFGEAAQAQIQSLNGSANTNTPTTMNSIQGKSPPLYVEKKKHRPGSVLPAEGDESSESGSPPEDEAGQELDREAQEIDRVFEKYKQLSQKQKDAELAQPLKNNPRDDSTASALKPAPASPASQTQKQAPSGGFASILDRYQQGKANRSNTQSMQFGDPSKTLPKAGENAE